MTRLSWRAMFCRSSAPIGTCRNSFLTVWSDVDFQQKRITIHESKAGEARHIPMNGIVIQTLQAVPRMLHNPHVF